MAWNMLITTGTDLNGRQIINIIPIGWSDGWPDDFSQAVLPSQKKNQSWTHEENLNTHLCPLLYDFTSFLEDIALDDIYIFELHSFQKFM